MRFFGCKCKTCRLVREWPAFAFDKKEILAKDFPCIICSRLKRLPSGPMSQVICPYVDPMVEVFFGSPNVCKLCMINLDSYLTLHFEQCWQTVTYEAACLAFVGFLRSYLGRLANNDTYLKSMRTRYTGTEYAKYYG